ncbi:MAG: hypothetical protein ACREYF_14655 [Gammaproteobacteria bacterium]
MATLTVVAPLGTDLFLCGASKNSWDPATVPGSNELISQIIKKLVFHPPPATPTYSSTADNFPAVIMTWERVPDQKGSSSGQRWHIERD